MNACENISICLFTLQNYESAAVVRFIANWGSCSVTDEEKFVQRPKPGTEETVETITFGTAPSKLDAVDEPSEDTPQTDGAAQPVADSEEDANKLNDAQQNEGQDTGKTDANPSQDVSQQNSNTDNTSESEAE